MAELFSAIWCEKYRPKTLNDIVLTKEVREFLDGVKSTQDIPHLLFYGTPGCGKTSLAKIIATDILDVTYMYINASDERGIDVVRSKITSFVETKSIDGKFKIVILDEMDGFTGDAQRALRNTMEEHCANSRFILTANSFSRIITPIRSRAIGFNLLPPQKESMAFCLNILQKENVELKSSKESLVQLIRGCYPDLRRAINQLNKYTKDGILDIPTEEENYSFAEKLWGMIGDKKVTDNKLRQYVIENELEFSNDYNSLLKGLFESVYHSDLSEDKKREAIILICDGMYRHTSIMDFEINAFCTMLKVRKIL